MNKTHSALELENNNYEVQIIKKAMKLNMYISNIPKEEVLKEQMHELYSLR